jgi:hypothetical protein
VESSCELGNEPSCSIKCWELPSGCTSYGLSSGTQLHRVGWLVSDKVSNGETVPPSLLILPSVIAWFHETSQSRIDIAWFHETSQSRIDIAWFHKTSQSRIDVCGSFDFF